MKRMFLVFAHPDDESFAAGGTVAKYRKAGWEVSLLCATAGQKGDVGSNGPVSDKELGVIRRRELEEAAGILGISEVTVLDYQDGKLAKLEPGELEDKIHKKLVDVVPDVVITFDTTGVSNHPDHSKVCYAATFAFQKYAAWVEGQLGERTDNSSDILPKLYWACMPESIAAFLARNNIIPRFSFGKPWRGVPDRLVTTVIDIKQFTAVKRKALVAHRTQEADAQRFLSFAANPLARHEYFMLRMQGTTEVFMNRHDHVSNRL